ncbi:MAG: class I SAM-dependent methyltransferase [Candidatus Peribacteria bacterium]|jgi:trans-aconitate methyltransferase|nr:class I SAM-dependent methyltransferase [Candidatus Peribacteria bacterium]
MKEGNLTTKSFIDVGCGVPLIPDFIKDLGCKDVHGLEYNPRIVNMVKSHYPDVALHEDNMLTYQEYGKYDILYTYNPLRDPEDMEKALLIIMNQMKPGAVLYFMKACDCDLFLKNHGFVCQNGRYGIYKFVKPEKDGV